MFTQGLAEVWPVYSCTGGHVACLNECYIPGTGGRVASGSGSPQVHESGFIFIYKLSSGHTICTSYDLCLSCHFSTNLKKSHQNYIKIT